MNSPNCSVTDLARLQQQLTAWRRSQSGRPRLPRRFWEAATRLAGRHGVSRVARALRLDYYRLQRHLKQPPLVRSSATDSASFVELKFTPPVAAPSSVGTVELFDGTSRRLRIETGLNPSVWVDLVEAFWRTPL